MQNRFHAALNTLPSPLQSLLTDIVCADTFLDTYLPNRSLHSATPQVLMRMHSRWPCCRWPQPVP